MHLKTVINVLYFMRHSTGSQCRSRSTGVMWSRRNVNVNHILYILSETVGEPTIHDFCEHTYAHQWEFPSTQKLFPGNNAMLLVNM